MCCLLLLYVCCLLLSIIGRSRCELFVVRSRLLFLLFSLKKCVVCRSLFVACCLSFVVVSCCRLLLFCVVRCCFLFLFGVDGLLLFVVSCSLFVVECFVVRCFVSCARCSLCVVRCLSFCVCS